MGKTGQAGKNRRMREPQNLYKGKHDEVMTAHKATRNRHRDKTAAKHRKA